MLLIVFIRASLSRLVGDVFCQLADVDAPVPLRPVVDLLSAATAVIRPRDLVVILGPLAATGSPVALAALDLALIGITLSHH